MAAAGASKVGIRDRRMEPMDLCGHLQLRRRREARCCLDKIEANRDTEEFL